MSPTARLRIQEEMSLVERYVGVYHRRLAGLIGDLNGSNANDRECLKMCVEAVDVILTSQNKLCRTLREMSNE